MIQDLSGQSIKGYELHELIGAGGFGAVYRAHQTLLRRDVAMKIVLPEYANHPEFIRRFDFEAQIVARLEHIHIVSLYDYWREPDGAYLIMRWLRGGSLRHRLRDGPLDTRSTAHIVEQVASALASAHRRGVVHRDIKPDNILFDEEDNAYLADFGIAKDLRELAYGDGATTISEGALTGSPFYLAPEQAQSQPVSPQTDLYSLGIVIYEMLTGHPPFTPDGGLMAILLSHINDPVPSVRDDRPDLPAEIDSVIERATAKLPQERYPDAISLANDLRRALVSGADDTAAAPVADHPDEPLDDVLVITKPLSESTLIVIPEAAAVNPYKGLHPFEEADAADFFGRTALVERLIERLKEPKEHNRFLAVIGPSGSGKSSVVKAGLVPALRQGALRHSDQWYMSEMVPGHDPFRELASALLGIAVAPPERLVERLRSDPRGLVDAVEAILPPGPETGLLLVIDQFEEVFTLVENEADRVQFLTLLQQAVDDPDGRFRLIITLRADFYDRPLLYPGFGELVRQRNEVVLPLSAEEMREAIIGPAKRVGVTVESGLVAAVIAEVAEQPGALPLMQYALTEVFERREDNTLTLEAYHASGGVLGALARRAEELYQDMDAQAQATMRQIVMRLVTIGEGTDDTRRRVMLSELLALGEDETVVSNVIDTLGKYRLLTFDHDPDTRVPTVTVAHEALIREWDRLRSWLDESREDLLLQRRLAAANEEWQRQNRDPSFLATGMRLQQFEGLLSRGTIALTPEEREYVQASVAEREAREAAERARQEREAALEKRSRDRLRILVAVMAVAAVVALVLAGIALVNYQKAEDERQNAENQQATAVFNAQVAEEQRQIAERNAAVSRSLALAASAQTELVSGNNDLAIALALIANDIPDPPIESQLILAKAAFAPGTRRVYPDHGTFVFTGVFSPDGSQMLSGAFDQLLYLWDVDTGEVLQTFEGHESFIRHAAFAPDGQTVLSAGQDAVMILWDVATGEIIRRFGPDDPETDAIEGHARAVRSVVYTPDGTRALSASDDGTLILWDLDSGEILHQFTGHEERVRGAAISPDGHMALSASYDTTLKLWDLDSGEEIRTYEGHTDKATCVAFSPDGTQMLSGAGDRTIRLWDVETGEELLRMEGHGAWIKSVAFSPDGRFALSASDDGSVRLWSLETGDELMRFIGHADFVEQAVFRPGHDQVLSASGDGTLRLWDLTNGAEIRRFNGHTEGVISADISADGTKALTGGFDSAAYVWDVATGEQIGAFTGHSGFVEPAIFNPDGTLAFTSDSSGSDPESAEDDIGLLWDVTTGEVVQQFVGHMDWIQTAAFSPDGTQLVTGAKDNRIIVWDVATGDIVQTIEEYEDWVDVVAFNADGTRLLSGGDSSDPRVILWDTATWEPVRTFEGHVGAVNGVAFSPNDDLIASASDDNLIIVWDALTGSIVHRLQGHTASVQDVAFSPDGTLLASISYDGTARLWDVASGVQVRQFDNGAALWSMAYTPDGKALLTGSQDTTVRLWDARPLAIDDLLAWTRANRYITELTCLQRAQFRVDPQCDELGNLPES